MSKILITGASGHLGQAVVQHLLKLTAATNISVLVRDRSKVNHLISKGVTVLVGDYDAIDTLIAAFDGIEKLYIVSGNDISNRSLQHLKIVDAAKQASIRHIFYTSFQRKPDTRNSPISFIDNSHKETEEMIKNSGITYTILKHAFYTDMLPVFFGQDVITQGFIGLPAGNGKVSFATRDDMGEAGALLLAHHAKEFENKEIDLAGRESFSMADIAAVLTELAGKPVIYHDMKLTEFTTQMQCSGFSTMMTTLVSAFSQAVARDELNIPDPTLEMIIGRKPTGIKAFFQASYQFN